MGRDMENLDIQLTEVKPHPADSVVVTCVVTMERGILGQ